MYWSRTLTYGRGPSRPLRAHTANLIGEKLYVFGGCDTSLCFNTLYILDMGRYSPYKRAKKIKIKSIYICVCRLKLT